jgi:hypothetical protein
MVAAVFVPTGTVLTVNVADVAPAGTVIEFGAVAFTLEDERDTSRPPVGAGLLRLTVAVEEPPPATVEGERASARGG